MANRFNNTTILNNIIQLDKSVPPRLICSFLFLNLHCGGCLDKFITAHMQCPTRSDSQICSRKISANEIEIAPIPLPSIHPEKNTVNTHMICII